MCKKLYFLTSFLLLISLASSNRAAVIYYDNFDGPNGVDLNGTTPDITPGGETWTAGSWADANGHYGGGSSGQMFTAGLPFTPSIGTIYELSATVDNHGDWVGIGFVGSGFTPGTRLNDNGPMLWALVRQQEGGAKDQAFVGPGTAGGLGDAPTHSASTLMVRIETNSTTSWVVTWYFDGSKAFQQNVNPTGLNIAYAAFGSNGLFSACTGTISSFKLEEIEIPTEAWYPSPEDEATGIPLNTVISWREGVFADKHDVYLGTDSDDVNTANRTTPLGVLVSQNQDPNSYSATGLIPGTTYYWRIDEVNDTHPTKLWKGNVWSFTVIPPTASNPVPSNGNIFVNPDIQLSWTPGPTADKHDVYIGTDIDSVSDANRAAHPGLLYYSENQDASSYPASGTIELDPSQTYYWRIDEVNDPNIWEGDVWSFTTMNSDGSIVIGNWEQEMDEWYLWSGTASYSNTVGVTLDNYSLRQAITPGDGYLIVLSLADLPGGADAFFANNSFSVDITRLASEWEGDGSSGITLYIQADGAGWQSLGSPANSAWTPGDGDSTVTVTWSYANLLGQVDPNASRIDLMLWQNAADFTVGGIYYYDNARLFTPILASNPNPADVATNVQGNPTLTWTAGPYAVTHNVYFGTDYNEVESATSTSHPNVDYADIDVSYYQPGVLDFNTTYYWRIDEVNDNAWAPLGSPWKGNVWQFTTGEYFAVDNMDLYGDDAEAAGEPGGPIYYVWRDGWWTDVDPHGNYTGSQTYHWNTYGTDLMESRIVRSGMSMPFYYENDGDTLSKPLLDSVNPDNPLYYYSEASVATSNLTIGSDWTKGNVKSLVIWFYGDPDNDAGATEQMYVKLNGSKIAYNGDMSDIKKPYWHEWNIELADFGINLNNVTSISLGFGNETNTTTPGGAGIVYFDDILLYPARCVPSIRSPDADLDNDCDVDYDDLAVMTGRWLDTDSSSDPLVAWYKLDEGSGTTAADSSAYDNDGTLIGVPEWVSGYFNGGLDFNGVSDYVDCGNDVSLDITDAITLAAWVDTNDSGNSEHNPYVTKGDTSYAIKHHTSNSIQFFIYDGTWYTVNNIIDDSFNDDWHHVAGTYDGIQLKLYVDGVLSGITNHIGSIASDTYNVNIGRNSQNTDRFYEGLIDDVRIYNKALSQPEVLSIMDGTLGSVSNYHPITSPAELYVGEAQGSRKIDFKDLAVMAADSWLEEPLLWP